MAYATTSQEIFSCFRTRFSCFYTISFDFGVTLILFTPNYTIDLHLHHSRYSFRQIHFWHLIFYMRHFCDMIVDIHSDLRIRVVFAPLRSVLNGCPPDIRHPITYCITLGFLMIFWKNGHLEKKNWNPARLPEMNILNGKSTGHRPVMTVVNGNRQNSGEIYINNSKTETLHLALNFGLLNLIRIRSVLSQLL